MAAVAGAGSDPIQYLRSHQHLIIEQASNPVSTNVGKSQILSPTRYFESELFFGGVMFFVVGNKSFERQSTCSSLWDLTQDAMGGYRVGLIGPGP